MILQAIGLVDKWDKELTFVKKETKFTILKALSLNHMQSAFYLLVIGYFVSSMIFVFEKLLIIFMKKEKCNLF